MAPHLRQYDLWDEFATAVDDVWEQLGLDTAIKQLQWLRSPVTPGGVVVSNDGKLVSLNDVDAQSRSSLVLTADLLGFRFNAPNLLRQKDYFMGFARPAMPQLQRLLQELLIGQILFLPVRQF